MTEKHNLEERILGLLMGIGIGTVLGFLLRERGNGEPSAGSADHREEVLR